MLVVMVVQVQLYLLQEVQLIMQVVVVVEVFRSQVMLNPQAEQVVEEEVHQHLCL
jgi:hypothetical protein